MLIKRQSLSSVKHRGLHGRSTRLQRLTIALGPLERSGVLRPAYITYMLSALRVD